MERKQYIKKLQDISKEHLKIDNLDAHPELSQALIQAYQLGKKNAE